MKVSMRGSLVAMVAAVTLVAPACGGSDDSSSAAPDASGEAVTTEATSTRQAVLVPTASGGQLDFNSLRGQDVLLWFWAPW